VALPPADCLVVFKDFLHQIVVVDVAGVTSHFRRLPPFGEGVRKLSRLPIGPGLENMQNLHDILPVEGVGDVYLVIENEEADGAVPYFFFM
jgi:hypothetical protein